MGAALINALREMLGPKDFSSSLKESWTLVYNVFAGHMCHGMHSDSLVLESWAKVKKMPYYKEKVGLLLFQHLFRHCPETKALFGFPSDCSTDTESLKSSMKFRLHAEYFILMFDKALQMVEEKKL